MVVDVRSFDMRDAGHYKLPTTERDVTGFAEQRSEMSSVCYGCLQRDDWMKAKDDEIAALIAVIHEVCDSRDALWKEIEKLKAEVEANRLDDEPEDGVMENR